MSLVYETNILEPCSTWKYGKRKTSYQSTDKICPLFGTHSLILFFSSVSNISGHWPRNLCRVIITLWPNFEFKTYSVLYFICHFVFVLSMEELFHISLPSECGRKSHVPNFNSFLGYILISFSFEYILQQRKKERRKKTNSNTIIFLFCFFSFLKWLLFVANFF